jgi:RNA 3'-terminal phosphate cyclase (ATP)
LDVAEVQCREIRQKLSPFITECVTEEVPSDGPGNVVMINLEYRNITQVFTAFGTRKDPPIKAVRESIEAAQAYLASDSVVVDEHLADQLLIPVAIAGGGSFLTIKPSLHTTTNMDVIRIFLSSVDIKCNQVDDKTWRIDIVSNV